MKYIRCFLLLFFFPFLGHAQVVITEVMYDAAGTDTGYEWVEIYNEGDTNIDIAQWFFYENNVNHGLTPLNSAVLEAGTYAVIIQHEEKFVSVYGDDILLIKSSFSLNNTSETISIANPEKEIINSLTYNASVGAVGDGNSISLVDGKYVAATATPGIKNLSEVSGTVVVPKDSSSDSPKASFDPYYEGYITTSKEITKGNDIRIQAGAYYISEKGRAKKLRGVYEFNLGNGLNEIHYERIDSEYIYEYPGDYLVTLDYYTSLLAYENQSEPRFTYSKLLRVSDNTIEIEGVTDNGALIIANPTRSNIDLTQWEIQHLLGTYIFPKNSIILAGSSIALSHQILGMYVTRETLPYLVLSNPQGLTVATKQSPEIIERSIAEDIVVPGSRVVVGEKEEVLSALTDNPSPNMLIGFISFSIILLIFRLWMRYKKTK